MVSSCSESFEFRAQVTVLFFECPTDFRYWFCTADTGYSPNTSVVLILNIPRVSRSSSDLETRFLFL